ncbi:MAG: ABC transporter ATP-binding protein [Paludibacteraceae bacterium]|nr:ABC transporter ATP-binding protein [Paludibacteraceae bacterium]
MITAKNINKSFGRLQVLKNVNLHVSEGEFVTIMGASGAGKTTLLQILGTLDKPDSGSVLINETPVLDLKGDALASFRNNHIGFVFQFHQLLPEFTALENILIPAMIGNRPQKECEENAEKLLEYLNIKDRAHHKPNELSGGEKQRVAVARALINHPDVIFADEPSGSLDSKNKEELHNLFLDLKNRFGQTLVIVTHDPELAKISDRIIQMRDGMIIE